MDKSLIIILVQVVIIFAVVLIVTLFLRLNNAFKLEKRIAKYSVRYDKEKSDESLIDKVWHKYISFVKKQRKKIRKMLPWLTSKYDKYSVGSEYKAEDFITHKIVISLLFLLLTFISVNIQGKLITMLQIIFSLAVGFYILDIYLLIANRINKRKIENDMLRAIIIMNNAFKSGKSTIQAVEIASKKLPKPIGYEFKKISEEMQYGLAVDTVFDRFAKRVNIEEAEYLSSSLIILNRTGGNIVAVFDSIEKTLFDKKKLKEELKQSTTVSKLVTKILLFVPVVFVLIIYLLNPDYFDPFFASPLGYVMVLVILVMFIIYAYLLGKIVKVEY
ncbi:MAG: type II secretion system F family protein [Bacilli bacterium]|nr:type II secretion system F family protein [Bacilli bacterium]